jgi:phage shock protein PspC (stress-responsive transcriptional regulator)
MDQTKSCSSCFETIDARAVRCPRCTQRQPDAPGLFRGVPGRLVGGVCAALAQHFGWDLTVMRVVLVASLAITGGMGLWVYAGLWLMTPFTVNGQAPATRFVDWLGRVFAPPAASPTDPS